MSIQDNHPAGISEPSAAAQPEPQKLFIISGRCGRLANRTVLFANFIAMAAEHGYRVMNPTFHSYAHLFETTRRDIYCHYPTPARRSWLDIVPGVAGTIRGTRLFFRLARPASELNERLPIFGNKIATLREGPGPGITALDGPEVKSKIEHARIVLVNGWNFRAPELVRRHAAKIRQYFQPIRKLLEASERAVTPLRKNADVLVGVHIRQGDYRTWRDGQCFFSIPHYAKWMHELAAQFPSSKLAFLICSDEPRDQREFPALRVGFGAGSPVGDLCALAKCDYIFGPLSTFSQWASFYGAKPLFHLSNREQHLELSKFSVSDLKEVP